jgi:hypothetical protein
MKPDPEKKSFFAGGFRGLNSFKVNPILESFDQVSQPFLKNSLPLGLASFLSTHLGES